MKHASKFFGLLALTALVSFPALPRMQAASRKIPRLNSNRKATLTKTTKTPPARERASLAVLEKVTRAANFRSRRTTAPLGC